MAACGSSYNKMQGHNVIYNQLRELALQEGDLVEIYLDSTPKILIGIFLNRQFYPMKTYDFTNYKFLIGLKTRSLDSSIKGRVLLRADEAEQNV